MDFIAASKSQSRVFVAEGLPGPDNLPLFQGCLVMGGASQGLGDVEYIYCPDPENYTRFVPVGEIVGKEENVETSISGHFPLNALSQIIKWGRAKTPLAIHVHFGTATNPQNFNVFQKAVIFDNRARITSTDIEEMGSLEESGKIGQSADISAADYYEVVGMNYISRVPALITSPGAGVAMARIYNDALPIDERFGFYVVEAGATAAAASLLYSIDGGATFKTLTLGAAGELAAGVAVINDIPVVAMAAADLFYADVLKGAMAVTKVTFAQAMTCITSVGAVGYVGGAAGYVGKLSDATSPPAAMTTGGGDDVTSIHALEGGVILVGDGGGNVYHATDGENFGASVVNAGQAATAVCAVDSKIFWAGFDDGKLFYTIDGGSTWKERGFPGSGTGSVTGITFPTLSVGFIAHQGATGNARILKTVGAGAIGTWYQVPRTGSLPGAKNLVLASVDGEPNRVLATGVDSTVATDGVIVYGSGV